MLTLDLKKYARTVKSTEIMGPAQSIKSYAPSPVSTVAGTPTSGRGSATPTRRTPGSTGSLGKRRVTPYEDVYRPQQESLLADVVEEGEYED